MGKTTVEFWLQQHVYEGAAIVPEDDVNVSTPAEEAIDPSAPLSPEGGPHDPSSVASSLMEMTMASPITPASKRVRFDSNDDYVPASLAALDDEYVALQSDIIWERLQPRLEESFIGLRGDMPSTLRQVFEIQRHSTTEDIADVLMPESKLMLLTKLKTCIDFDGMVGVLTDVPEVKALLSPRYADLLDTEIDKMVAFSSASPTKPADANPVSQLAPVSSRGMAQSRRKGRKK